MAENDEQKIQEAKQKMQEANKPAETVAEQPAVDPNQTASDATIGDDKVVVDKQDVPGALREEAAVFGADAVKGKIVDRHKEITEANEEQIRQNIETGFQKPLPKPSVYDRLARRPDPNQFDSHETFDGGRLEHAKSIQDRRVETYENLRTVGHETVGEVVEEKDASVDSTAATPKKK